MRYVEARIQQEYRETAYRIYVTDSLQGIPQNKYLKSRFYDLIKGHKEEKTGDEILAEVIQKCGLVLDLEEQEDECI